MRRAESRVTSTTPPPLFQHARTVFPSVVQRGWAGNELTRVTVVNFDGKVLMDELVVPKNPILDYKTKYSGITAAMLEGVTTTLENVRLPRGRGGGVLVVFCSLGG